MMHGTPCMAMIKLGTSLHAAWYFYQFRRRPSLNLCACPQRKESGEFLLLLLLLLLARSLKQGECGEDDCMMPPRA